MTPLSSRTQRRFNPIGALVGALAFWLVGCAEPLPSGSGTAGAGSGGGYYTPPSLGPSSGPAPEAECTADCTDFPAAPIFDSEKGPAPPANAPSLFGSADSFSTPGPCVIEPELSTDNRPGALLPANWLRPRFRFQPAGNQDLWEIRLQADREANDLVAYTTQTTWVLPKEIWEAVAKNVVDEPITVTIRGVNTAAGGTPSGTRGSFTIAPVLAGGKMVYWASTSAEVAPDTSKLVGFAVGDDSVIDALTIPQVGDRQILAEGGRDLRGMYTPPRGVGPGHVQCIGCHVATPDGKATAFVDHWPWNVVLASVEEQTVGQRPSYLTPGAEMLLNQPWLGIPTFSRAHWYPGDRRMITSYSKRNPGQGGVGFTDTWTNPRRDDGLAWFDLETTAAFFADRTLGDVARQLNQQIAAVSGAAYGMIALEGETRSASTPDWSHDGTRIAYSSSTHTHDGRLGAHNSEVDIHLVPYNNGSGGTVTPLTGASEPGVAEYYPAFSADDRLIAFNRVAVVDNAMMYYRPDAEIYVIPSEGGVATRLLANDPPACTGEGSPGVINSWPKWSPNVVPVTTGGTGAGRTYYWLIFSSARDYPGAFQLPQTQYSPPDTRSSQLYMSGVVVDEASGEITTYPAVYLWNQEATTSNLTPAWDEFKIPDVPIE